MLLGGWGWGEEENSVMVTGSNRTEGPAKVFCKGQESKCFGLTDSV